MNVGDPVTIYRQGEFYRKTGVIREICFVNTKAFGKKLTFRVAIESFFNKYTKLETFEESELEDD